VSFSMSSIPSSFRPAAILLDDLLARPLIVELGSVV
jgi:hypothetical protein